MPSPANPLLTPDQAADALGTGPDFITGLVAAGHLDHTGHGDDLRVPESALIAYAIAATTSPAEAPVADLSANVRPVPAPIVSAA